MAYFAVYNILTGEIENIVESPEFLADKIYLGEGQGVLPIQSQVSPHDYLIIKGVLISKQ